jgi:hypothetical protein
MISGINLLGTALHLSGQIEPRPAKIFQHQHTIPARTLELEHRFTVYEIIFPCVQ